MKLALTITTLFGMLAGAQQLEFNRDIRPILSDKCFFCHGPDQANRKSKLRLDTETGAAYLDKKVIVERIKAEKPAMRMPPVYSGKTLSDGEIATLERWVGEGAQWEKHWSFVAPRRRTPPSVATAGWPANPIDNFVLARLEKGGLKPAPESDRSRLLRRITFDLTGLPPTPAEVDDFLANSSTGAYEQVVDRLLKSPRFGERMAIRWLDAARYADTQGYQSDGERVMWRWRDWVIDAFNANKPYDQFLTEQLAGDLLPNARRDQIIATGFNRNHRGNSEGGIIPEEYAVEYVVDRVDTFSTVFLGLTAGCARCHDHKYDPLTQKEYYQLYAFFNNIGEWGRYIKYGNTPPYIAAPTKEQEKQLIELEARSAEAQKKWRRLQIEVTHAEKRWAEEAARSKASIDWMPGRALQTHVQLAGAEGQFDGIREVNAGLQTGGFGYLDKFTVSLWMKPAAATGAVFARGKDATEELGYGLYLINGKLQFHLTQRWLDDALRVETEQPMTLNQWHQVTVRYDATRLASGVRIDVDGKQAKLKTLLDMLNQSFFVTAPFRIGGGSGRRFSGEIRDVRVFTAALHEDEMQALAPLESVSGILAIASAKRTEAQRAKLSAYFIQHIAAAQLRSAWSDAFELGEAVAKLKESLPSVMVMQELPNRPDTHVLIRGAYDRLGVKVDRGVPAALPSLPGSGPVNRLALAKWLTAADHPLTARVAVNRMWQMVFGVGIVKTVEDFGSQGEWPSNLELLDWLATEFVKTGWDVKAMIKTMVTSSTYRQSSRASDELIAKDPENRLLARGPRQRLAAEMVRDQALLAAGLLVEKLGGPSVKPYQPAGLWKELSNDGDYVADKGEGLYRRSLYTYWKRTIPPPFMMNFDSAGREACTVRETRTNTPLQALNLMNDVTYLEASRKLAERMVLEGGRDVGSRIGYGFKLLLARAPNTREMAVLRASFDRARDRFQTKPADAMALLKQGDSVVNSALDQQELAAYAHLASLILNLDEVVSKE